MKRTLVLLLTLCCISVAFGQDKEVAVLNPKITGGTVKETDKLIIVSSMKKAFTQIDGYKAFTRQSQELIDAEAEFQRSGKVPDALIKKIGQQTAASYICTFTLASDGNELVVNSDIIDVVGGEIIKSDLINILNRNDRNDVMEQCQSLAYSLLGASHSDGNVKQPIAKRHPAEPEMISV
ncbi:hypothetical protein AGMMS49525_09550 [Bacteroidia bacterium]|nr:hypothetical protein AGMMS49525_09550 [Bacteroidia bacterium]